jgi:5-methylthioadenosine/S-adenosylhomocysteine deaminase
MEAVKPDYAAVAFDLKAPTFRHEMYEHYKEGRRPTPPDLLMQFDDAKEVLNLMGIHVLELEGYEADDIQGTIAKMAHGCGDNTESYVLSGDRDLLQLIDDKITVLLAANNDTVIMRENEFKENISLIKNHNNTADGRITTMFGPHSVYTASVDLLERVRKEADKYNVGIHIHMNETQKEINDCMEEHDNKRPFELLDSIDFLGDDVVAAHGVWLGENEINLIKENDVKISHNPCSNMKLASGAAPTGKLLSEGICVGLGTDGASSNNNLDMFDEMKFAALLAKVSSLNPELLSANEVINMATFNGAKALGINAGSIEVGKAADLILVDSKAPNMTPQSGILASNLVYAANGSNVDTTIVNGQVLMENRELTLLDEAEVLEKAVQAIGEMKELRAQDVE